MNILIIDGDEDTLQRFRRACPDAKVVFFAEIDGEAIGAGLAASAALRRRGDLTARQFEVLRLIGKGLANKEIAERLSIARDTVKQHARAAYAALGVTSRTQALTVATRRGLRLD